MELLLNGLIEDMSNADYHASAGISKSGLDKLAISPLAYWDAYINPDREPQEDRHCFAVGDGTHKLVLEPGTFEEKYAVGFDKSAYPEALDTMADMKKELSSRNMMVSGSKPELADRLVNEGGFPAARIMYFLEKEHAKTMQGRTPIPAINYKNMLASLKAINSHHTAGQLIEGCYAEQSYYATDENGILRKCRPDIITNNGQIMVDLKTTEDVSAEGFGRSVSKFRYHVQGAWYLDIFKMLYGSDAPKIFAFIPAQKIRPYDVSVQFLTDDQIALGRAMYQKDLALLTECLQNDYWPGQDGGEILEVTLPAWEMNKNLFY